MSNNLKTFDINGEKLLICCIVGDNRDNRIVDFHKAVFDKFSFPINYFVAPFSRGINYGSVLDWFLNAQISSGGVDYYMFFDMDAIPLKKSFVTDVYSKIKDKQTLFGIAQQSSHIKKKNGTNQHCYVGNAVIAFSKQLYCDLGKPSFVETYRGDIGEELTWMCQEKGKCVSFIYPSHYHKLTDQEIAISGNQRYWELDNGLEFGLGTTYGDFCFHAFMQNLPRSQELFISKCQEVLSKQASYKDIKGWCEFESIYSKVAEEAKDGSQFVELGTYLGRSAALMGQLIKDSGKKIDFYTVDSFVNSEGLAEYNNDFEIGGGNIFNQFKQNIEKCGLCEYIKPIISKTQDAADKFGDNSLDFVFVDASHKYEDVIVDLAKWYPKLKNGGVMAGHDAADYAPGVVRALNEFFGDKWRKVNGTGSCWFVSKPQTDRKIEMVTACVNMADFLDISLAKNKPLFDNIIVVTSSNDHKTKEVCLNHGVGFVETDLFFKNGAEFDRGAAVSFAYNHLKYKDWVVNADVDIVYPEGFRDKIGLNNLDSSVLYGVSRAIVPKLKDWTDLDSGSKTLEDFEKIEGGWGCGYTQIFNFRSEKIWHMPTDQIYPSNNNVCENDIWFLKRFHPDVLKVGKINLFVTHLGPHTVFNNGRNDIGEFFGS